MESKFVTRAEIVATLEAWQRRELTAEQVWAWAEALYAPGHMEYDDWEGDSSVANEILSELDNLPMNLVVVEDIALHLAFLASPPGRFDDGYRHWQDALGAIDWNARARNLSREAPYARYCGDALPNKSLERAREG